MDFRRFNGRVVAGLALAGFILAAAGCQAGDNGVLGIGGNKAAEPAEGKVKASDLTGYCPRATLRDGTSFFNTYAKGGQDDATKIIYQASISDTTRDCIRSGGMMTMNIGVAGRVVPGPLGTTGSITMPIRIVVVHGSDVLYSQLHKFQVQISDTSAATQFVFNDPNVVIPEPTEKNYAVFVGFDEGPQPKKTASAQ